MFVADVNYSTSNKAVAESPINPFAVVAYNPFLEDPESLNSIVRHQPDDDSLSIDVLPDNDLLPKQSTSDIAI